MLLAAARSISTNFMQVHWQLEQSLRSDGMVLVEASMMGKPMVTCEIGTGISFVNLHGETRLTSESNPPSLHCLHWLKARGARKIARRCRPGLPGRLEHLIRLKNLPMEWAKQREMLGGN